MKIEATEYESESENKQPLVQMNMLRSYLTADEELAFMQILYSSSATLRAGNFGLPRSDVENMLNIAHDDKAFYSFINRVNEGLSRYYKLIYDEQRDQLVVMLRATAKIAKTTLPSEALAILLFIFYQQEVLQDEYTLLSQLLDAFGHEKLRASRKIKMNIGTLKKIGALEELNSDSNEEAYQLTAIGANMFSDSFLRRTIEFSQSQQFNKDEVLKFFKRYNLEQVDGEENDST